MAVVLGQVREPGGNVLLVGAQDKNVLLRAGPAEVVYTVGGTTYVDHVAAATPALEWVAQAPPFAAVTRRFVSFILPTYGGVTPLYVVDEAAWTRLTFYHDLIPLDYITEGSVERFQAIHVEDGTATGADPARYGIARYNLARYS